MQVKARTQDGQQGAALKGRGEARESGGLARLGVAALAAWKENQALGPVVQGPLLKTF